MGTYKETISLVDKVSPGLKNVIKNTGDMIKKLDKSSSKFTNLGNKGQDAIKKLESQMRSLNSTLSSIGKAFIAAFSIQKIAQVGSYINKMGSQFEDTLVDLEVMLGGAEKA